MGELVRVEPDEESGGAVVVLRLDRPPMNALSSAVTAQLHAAVDDLAGRDDLRAVVLWGGERLFAAGADVKEMSQEDYSGVVDRIRRLQSALDAVAALPVPVVAAITGYALGGGLELALCADVRFAADSARLGQPEIQLGIIPGAGGTQRLPRLVGQSRAKDLCFTGRHVTAEEALATGLVDRVVGADDVLAEALAWARGLATGPRLALRAVKAAVDRGVETDLATGLVLERELFAALWATRDARTGLQSFVEQGPGRATFEGR